MLSVSRILNRPLIRSIVYCADAVESVINILGILLINFKKAMNRALTRFVIVYSIFCYYLCVVEAIVIANIPFFISSNPCIFI